MFQIAQGCPIMSIMLEILVGKSHLKKSKEDKEIAKILIGSQYEKLQEKIQDFYKRRNEESEFSSILESFKKEGDEILSKGGMDLPEYYDKSFDTHEYIDRNTDNDFIHHMKKYELLFRI